MKEKQSKLEQLLNNKRVQTTVLLILIIIPVLLAFHFRIYPATLPATDQWAENSLQQNYIQQASAQIRQDFPLLPQAQVTQQAQTNWQEFKEQNKEQLQQQQAQLSQQFKSRLQTTITKDNGETYEQTYLLAIDPYYYLRRAELVADQGNVCDEIREGQCIDNRIRAPTGSSTNLDYHSLVEGIFVWLFGLFGYGSITGAFYIPAIFAALATIPIFFLVRKRYGIFAALIAASIVALHTAFLGRTPAGFVDTDVWNVFFPALIAWITLLGMDKQGKWRYLLIGLGALLTGIYSKFWQGWLFAFIVLLAVIFGAAVLAIIRTYTQKKNKKALKEYAKQNLIGLGIFFAITGIVVTILQGSIQSFFGSFKAVASYSLELQDPINSNLWPNVHTTVAELNVVNISNIIGQLGGRIFFITAIFGIFATAINPKKLDIKKWSIVVVVILWYTWLTSTTALNYNAILWLILFATPMAAVLIYSLFEEEMNLHYELFIMGWFVASIFAATQGTRFVLLLVPIFAIAVGFTAGWLVQAIPRIAKKELKLPLTYGKGVIMILLLTLIFTPVGANMIGRAHSVAMNEIPSMNDAWWEALTTIKEDSQPDAIITSWWDFGHWFKYVADRKVNFDGGTQNTPFAHWVGKLLQTSDERESIGILRMIDCGGNRAYQTIEETLQNNIESYRVTNNIIGTNKAEATTILQEAGIPEEQITEVLEYSHCTPPEAYIIASEDMVGKAGVWGHFGLWNFDRSFVYAASKTLNREEAIQAITTNLEVDETTAASLLGEVQSQPNRRSINTWISPWPGYGGGTSCQQTNQTINCGLGLNVGQQQGVNIIANNIYINKTDINSSRIILSAQGQKVGEIQPNILIINGERHELGGDFNLAFNIEGNTGVIAQPELIESRFTYLFFFEQPGEYLETLTKHQQVTGGKILVYKVNWEEYLTSIGETTS